MANDAAKKLIAKNRATLRTILVRLAIIQILYGLGGWLRNVSLFAAVCTSAIHWACYGAMFMASQPRYSASGEIESTGADISAGWWRYLVDVMIVACFAQFGSLLTAWAHLVFLSVPIYALYAGLGFLQNLSQMQQQMAPQEQAENPKDKKKLRTWRR